MKDIGFISRNRSSDYRCIHSIIKYRNCVVDLGPSRVVHCPELNACFLNQNLNCNTVHFGYAIPISVLPLEDNPDLAELVFDSSEDIDPIVAGYLLNNHPEFENIREGNFTESDIESCIDAIEDSVISELESNYCSFDCDFIDSEIEDEIGQYDTEIKKIMATTAKHDHMRKFTEPEEDIAAIAKQISDHAEAIYQTWKSRGLAPTEILTCHSNSTAADKFGTALTPKGNQQRSQQSPQRTIPQPPVTDILSAAPALDTNKLERLVNTFVVEDKARLAAAKNQKPSVQHQKPNSIQFALQKFEKNASVAGTNRSTRSPSPSVEYPAASYRTSPQPTQISRPVPANQNQLQTLDTIEIILPEEIVRKDVPQAPKRTEFDSSNTITTGVTTWPLKNKTVNQIKKEPQKLSPKNSEEYLDEVQREEERLINALKCGMIINEEPSSNDEIDGSVTVITQHDGKVTQHTVNANTALKNAILETISGKNHLTNNKKDTSSLSLVDYAKIRYKNAQENPMTQQRLEQSKQFEKPSAPSQVISVARNRFEINSVKSVQEEVTWKNKEVKEWLPAKVNEESVVNYDDSEKNKSKTNVIVRNRHLVSESVPHPELTSQQKQHIRQAGSNPVRPFLTRGSVAERVLIFEKCPSELLLDKRRSAPAITTWRTGSEVQTKAQTYAKEKEKENQRPSQPPHTTLQRHTKANKNVFIPRFYFPQGRPPPQSQIDNILQKLASDFRTFPMGQVPRDKFHIIVKTCECPLYWKVPLFIAAGGEKLGYVDAHSFIDYYKQLVSTCHDAASRFMKILVRNENRNFLLPEDFIPLIQDVVDTHPGLTFLKEANEFHSRYVHTVIARIFYNVNRSWSGRISLPEIRRSNLLQVIQLLEEEEDINQITQYFSYEHFYVIYCKFWELDRDHDLFIDRQDLTRHNDHALSSRMIDRIFSGAVTRGGTKTSQDRMSYTEFVWFLLSEEDKQHPTAIEYWFRCMDLDGDGYLSMYELEYFYEEQLQRMELLGIETLPFEDCLCQMLDMIHPQAEGKIALSDLKKCKMVTIFFDTFFNLEKYLDHEQRDPFASQRDHETDGEMSDWDRYAAEEYELLVAEEGGNDHADELMYDTDQSDEGISNADRILKVNNKKLDTIQKIQVPYTINTQLIPINMDDKQASTVFSTASEIQTNGTGSVRIKIQQCPLPDPDTTTSLKNQMNGLTISNGNWERAPSLKVTDCDDLTETTIDENIKEMDDCIASV